MQVLVETVSFFITCCSEVLLTVNRLLIFNFVIELWLIDLKCGTGLKNGGKNNKPSFNSELEVSSKKTSQKNHLIEFKNIIIFLLANFFLF